MADTVPLYVRVSPEQMDKLKRLSAENDRSLAATVRKLIDLAQEPKPTR